MNARERAGAVIDMFWLDWCIPGDNRPSVTVERIILAIEQAIITAEEAKAKGEREACLNLLDREARGFQVLIDHAPTPIRAEDLKRVKHSIENVAKLIRARSESEKKGEIMRSTKGLLKAFLNDEKLVSRKAPIEALGPEMSEKAIGVLKKAAVVTVGDFQDMKFDQVCALKCGNRTLEEILSHWHDIQRED